MASEEFAARAAKLFGALDAPGAPSEVVWHLNTQQGFAAGAEDEGSSEDDEAGPQSLPGAAGSDEDEDEYKAKASLQYCAAFEAEAEEDEFDLLAAGQGRQDAAEPAQYSHLQRDMQVLEDNAYDRSHKQHTHVESEVLPQSAQQQRAQQAHTQVPADATDCTAKPSSTQADAEAARHAGHHDALTSTQQNGTDSQHTAKRVKTRGGIWVPPHRRAAGRSAAEQEHQDSGMQQQQQQQQHTTGQDMGPGQQQSQDHGAGHKQHRRVTFSREVTQHDGGQQQQQQLQRYSRPDARRGGRQGRGVPDHVVHPHKYTVYVLDEPLFVGQGGADVQSEAAAGSWQQEQQHWRSHQQQQQPGKARHLDANSRAEIEEPIEQLRVGAVAATGHADVSFMDVDEEPHDTKEAPGAGAIKFAPTGRPKKASSANQQAKPGCARGAFVDEELEDEMQAVPAAAVPSRSTAKTRQYRSKDDRV